MIVAPRTSIRAKTTTAVNFAVCESLPLQQSANLTFNLTMTRTSGAAPARCLQGKVFRVHALNACWQATFDAITQLEGPLEGSTLLLGLSFCPECAWVWECKCGWGL